MVVETSVRIDENSDLITCTVMDTDGRQNRAQMHIFVQFGPKVSVVAEQIYAYDDLSAEIQCIVYGYPEPQVEWYYRRSTNVAKPERLSDPVTVKKTAPNQYLYTLFVSPNNHFRKNHFCETSESAKWKCREYQIKAIR
ncbi:unnamed protein product [Gongylonema pulchrum]|uniref:Ig-like domain-containing protein n=1 Tax=Gongylonema pulchrum TaxID=637853 RepID=A0A183F0T0_9BILA|nr:unnamed protein product [Gongylonema pulchrum]